MPFWSFSKLRPFLLCVIFIFGVLLSLQLWNSYSVARKQLKAWKETENIIQNDLSFSETDFQYCDCKAFDLNGGKWQKKKLGCPKNNITVRASLNTIAGTVPIYVYDDQIDVWVSKSIIEKNEWEPKLMKIVTDVMHKDDTLDFIDIGSNVGAYTMTLAKMGRRVLAIEALPLTARMLCMSIQDAKFTNPVPILINNVISNKRSQFVFGFDFNNIGGTYVVEKTDKSPTSKIIVHSVLLDDVLEIFRPKHVFMKVDVEKHELKIFEGAKRFFEEVNVKYILMEMVFTTTEDFERASQVIHFLTSRNMTPFLPDNLDVPTDRETLMKSRGGKDIIWKKL